MNDSTTNTAIANHESAPASAIIAADLAESAMGYAERSMARKTRKAYQAQVASFVTWCSDQGLAATPAAPQTVAVYITAKADEGRKVATISQALSAIGQAHQLAGLDNPCASAHVKKVWQGIRRTLGTAPDQKAPVLVDDLRRMMAALPDNLIGVRDQALLLVGFAGAFRRSELVALTVADLNTIRAWLGHASLTTTNLYAEADLEMKSRALAACEIKGGESGAPWREDRGLMAFLDTL